MSSQPDFTFYSSVDDALYDELLELVGEPIAHLSVWEDSMVDALASQGVDTDLDATNSTFDMDIYLGAGVYFELYSVAVYPDLDAEPLTDREQIEARMQQLVANDATLGDVAVDEEDALVLVLHDKDKPALYLSVGGWVIEEWDELPV